mgnify:CR=1 FL=1
MRLYRQFATDLRLLRYAGKNNVLSLYYFKGSDISSDDVVLEAESEVNTTPAQIRIFRFSSPALARFSSPNSLSPAKDA